MLDPDYYNYEQEDLDGYNNEEDNNDLDDFSPVNAEPDVNDNDSDTDFAEV